MQRLQILCAAGAVVLITVMGDYFALQRGQDAGRKKLLAHAVQRIEQFPEQIGPWALAATEPFSARTVQMLQVEGYTNRSYVHSETGEHVTLILLAGPAGPLVAHSPEVCMQSRDFAILSAAEHDRISVEGGSPADLRRTTFKARSLRGEVIDVYYAWSRNGRQWVAPEHPRIALGGSPMLYKLQIAAWAPLGADDPQISISKRFLQDLLPVLQRELSTLTL
jgi:hypothetical protein